MAGILDALLVELWTFITPARRAVASSEQLKAFLERFGHQLPDGTFDDAFADLRDLKQAIDAFRQELWLHIRDVTAMTDAQATALAAKAGAVFAELRSLTDAGGEIAVLGLKPELFEELFDALLHDYLANRGLWLVRTLVAMDALRFEGRPATTSRRQEYQMGGHYVPRLTKPVDSR